MNTMRLVLSVGFGLLLFATDSPAKLVPLPPKYDEAVLKKQFDEFMRTLDPLLISREYPGAVRKLLSSDPESQIEALKTLAETGEIEVIPWLLPFLESGNKSLRIWTGASLDRLISSHALKRRDMSRPEVVIIRPLQPEDRDLRPLAWTLLKMFRKPDDGSTHAYAASMTRYLGVHEFERGLQQCLESKHPAVANKAKWALESLSQQRECEKETSNKAIDSDRE